MTYIISIIVGLLIGFILDKIVKLYKSKQEKVYQDYNSSLTYEQTQFNKIVKKREEDFRYERFTK